MKMLRAGKKLLIRGELRADDLFGVEEGSRVKFSTGEAFLVLRPTYADLIPHLPRASQVIYPKDTGPLLVWGDVFPGATVIEGGTGAGALTIALLRAVGPAGRVISYELREDFADAARKNVAAFFGDAPNWTIKVRDLYAGFDETGVDRMFLDLAEPGRALAVAASALQARRRAGLLRADRRAAQGHGRGDSGAQRFRRDRKLRDAASPLAGKGDERAAAFQDDRAFRVYHRVAQAGRRTRRIRKASAEPFVAADSGEANPTASTPPRDADEPLD